MTDETWEIKPLGKDYATTEEVMDAGGVERGAIYEWMREGLLPKPRSTLGRGIIAKWPMIALDLAKFVRSQRDLAFGLPEIRPRIVAAFGEKILDVLAKPRGPRTRGGEKSTTPAKKAAKKAAKATAKTSAKKGAKKGAKKKAAQKATKKR
ncbi:hypothetical protein [Nannocystis pusilla]|uniref:Helix-turn-helix domain-containing protein n=1 Tax=Nannocystis pusilla TaxID=889268 RepID=A0ABS7TN36_9BACT|nr:hypothetical protein [Nannocystis pusilla]MBZ5709642.1 hypothetical protein [Nannocystis pusilla]